MTIIYIHRITKHSVYQLLWLSDPQFKDCVNTPQKNYSLVYLEFGVALSFGNEFAHSVGGYIYNMRCGSQNKDFFC